MTDDFNQLVDTRYGRMLVNVNDKYLGATLLRWGEFAEGEVEVFAQLLGPGALALDVGANIGALTVPMARLVGETGEVLAFEPIETNHALLCANVALNSLANVRVFRAACGAERAAIGVPRLNPRIRENFGGASLRDLPATDTVPLVAIDDFRFGELRLIKIDVEGMEAEVIAGARETIARCQPALYVENDRAEKSPALIAAIRALGYRAWWHFPPLVSMTPFRNPEVDGPNYLSSNMICLPEAAQVAMSAFDPVRPGDTNALALARAGIAHAVDGAA